MAYRDNHIASRSYLAHWAGADGRLRVVRPPSPAAASVKPERVGYRAHFWGREALVRQVAEEQINRIESDAAVALRRRADEQPLVRGSRDWRAIALLIAVHLVRNPYGRERLRRIQLEILERKLPMYTERMSAGQRDTFLGHITADAYWVLSFGEELLATSDQPVLRKVFTKLGAESRKELGEALPDRSSS